MEALLALFGASFVAATLFPLPSEAALFAYLRAYPDHTVLAVSVATIGNTLGGMTTYFLGRLIPNRKVDNRALRTLHRWGAPATFFAWLPLIGDALSAGAGWLRVNWLAALLFMAAGRLSRYIVVAALA
ncbi:MAG TPA: DedA family protein [Burkholderiales bacterium]|nr:DedA family protein [Burkholderiales bacterium]